MLSFDLYIRISAKNTRIAVLRCCNVYDLLSY